MTHQRIKFISAFITLLLTSLFRGVLLLLSYTTVMSFNENVLPDKQVPVSSVINFTQVMPAVVLMIEAVCYIVFRKRYFLRKLVRCHIWMTIVSSIILPFVEFALLFFILPSVYKSNEMKEVMNGYETIVTVIGWTLFAIARLFFIAAMVKSVTSLNEQKELNEPSGFLDEFAK